MTGSLAGFGYPDNWVTQQVMATSQFKNGIKIGGTTYKVNIKSYDSQSSVTKAGTLAKQAIQQDNVDLLLASSTPETVNAVASQAETLGTPLICSNIPWESWYVQPGRQPAEAHAEAQVDGHVLPRRRAPGAVLQADVGPHRREVRQQPQGRRRLPERPRRQRLPRRVPRRAQGHRLHPRPVDGLPGRADQLHVDDQPFKNHGDDFFTNVPLPPDFATMWTQALQQGFKPKLATVAKVLLFPTDAYAMGSKVYNIATDSWWVPELPWTSSLDSQTCTDLGTAFTAAGLGQPNANISNYTLFEIAYAALTQVNDPHNKQELADALFKVKLPEAVAGPIDYTSTNAKTNPAPGVAITPPVGIQWQKGTKYPLEAKVVDNTLQPNAKITGDLLPTFS